MALPTEELLTASEVASLARVTPATVNAWARDEENELGQRKINGRWRFPRGYVLRFLGLEVVS